MTSGWPIAGIDRDRLGRPEVGRVGGSTATLRCTAEREPSDAGDTGAERPAAAGTGTAGAASAAGIETDGLRTDGAETDRTERDEAERGGTEAVGTEAVGTEAVGTERGEPGAA